MDFEHDSLLVMVTSVATGVDFHGENEHLATNVTVHVPRSDNEIQWPAIIVALYGDQADALETLEKTTRTVAELGFPTMISEDYKVNFRQGNRLIAGLVHANITKFRWSRDKGVEQVQFMIHARADGTAIGRISEQLRKKCRLETVSHQSELDLDGAAETEPEQTAPA